MASPTAALAGNNIHNVPHNVPHNSSIDGTTNIIGSIAAGESIIIGHLIFYSLQHA